MREPTISNDNQSLNLAGDPELALALARQGFFALDGVMAMLPPDALVPVQHVVALTGLIREAARRGGVG